MLELPKGAGNRTATFSVASKNRIDYSPYAPWCWYITQLGDLCWANVGKYSSTMEHMGSGFCLVTPVQHEISQYNIQLSNSCSGHLVVPN